MELRGKSLITIILLTSGIDFLLFGVSLLSFAVYSTVIDVLTCPPQYDQGLFGGILAGTRFQDMLGNPGSTMTGLVTAVYDIGCALGAVSAFFFGDIVGRKRSIQIANIIVIIGAAIQTASFSYEQMFVARIIAGVGVGFSTVAVPILQSETLPAHNRGSLLVVQSALIITGAALASWLALPLFLQTARCSGGSQSLVRFSSLYSFFASHHSSPRRRDGWQRKVITILLDTS